MGGGKSWNGAGIFISMAMSHPGTRYAVCRKNMTVLRRTTYQTFKKAAKKMNIIDGEHYKSDMNKQNMWEFSNGSQIWFVELDHTKDPDFDKLKGMELTAAMIDEVNEVIENAFSILMGRIGRENPEGVPQFIYMTCNPANNWVKSKFYTPWIKDELDRPYYFIQALPGDNPFNSKEYLEGLEDMPRQFYERYVRGNWDYVDDPDALVTARTLDKATTRVPAVAESRFVGVDVALEGSDRCVFSRLEGNQLADIFIPDIERTDRTAWGDEIADALIRYCERYGVGYENVAVDAVGNGASVRDACRAKEFYIKEFKSGSAEVRKNDDGSKAYDMLRSQSYYEMALAMDKGEFTLYDGCPYLDDFKQDMLAHKVEMSPKFIKVESKEKLKKRLGHSPDISDSVMMAYWAAYPTKQEVDFFVV